MRYYLDTEFIEDGKTIDLISIGIVADDGRELYCESVEADFDRANDWVKENVIPHLWRQVRPELDREKSEEHFRWTQAPNHFGGFGLRERIAQEVLNFCSPEKYGKPEFWGYYADYDWVVFCQLFGRMVDLPKGYPMYCNDLKQLCNSLGNPTLPKQDSQEHNALADARWNRMIHVWLEDLRMGVPDPELMDLPW